MAGSPTSPTPPGTSTADAPLMLSVSGARGIVGRTMTPRVASDFAAAYGSHVRAATQLDAPLFCVGRDSRPSGADLADAAVAGLLSVGCRVVRLGIVATPTVGVMIGERGADAGMVLTASHNPIEWNGLKCLTGDGLAPPKHEADAIIERFRTRDFDVVPEEARHAAEDDPRGHVTHVERVLDTAMVESIASSRFRVVLDSVNGAGCVAGRMLLDRLGCDLVHLNGEPTGRFAHTPEPLEANLGELMERTREESAACGFALDPDADRLAIVDERGRYIGEEYTLVLAAARLLRLGPRLRPGNVVPSGTPRVLATNLSTSRLIDDLAEWGGAKVIRTAVGEAHVAHAIQDAGAAALMGGEGNGGVIFPPVGWVRDSLSSMALVLGLLAAQGRPLSAIVDEMPHYCMIKRKMDLSAIGGRSALDAALGRLREHFETRVSDDGHPVLLNDADGVRIDIGDAWVHVRPSNTEPIVRVIAEAPTPERTEALMAEVAEVTGLG